MPCSLPPSQTMTGPMGWFFILSFGYVNLYCFIVDLYS